jgi:putative transcriptional regulator
VPKPSLAPSLLVAMPDLVDPNFRRTVVLLVHHDQDGSVGLVLNRPTELHASDLCSSLPESVGDPPIRWRGEERCLHWGGPVQENTGWVVAGENVLEEVAEVTPLGRGVHFAGSREALRCVADRPPERVRLFLGYAGWASGQLEGELAAAAWVVAPFSPEAIFDVDADELWEHAWRLLGIDPATVVSTPGVH